MVYNSKLNTVYQCSEAELARMILDELIRSVVTQRLEAYDTADAKSSAASKE